MSHDIQYFCIGHLAPSFQPRQAFTFVSSEATADDKAVVIPDDSLGPLIDGKAISEYNQLFGLSTLPQITQTPSRLFLFQYRKFLALSPGRERAANISYAYTATPLEAPAFFPDHAKLLSLEPAILVGHPISVHSLAHQYAAYHHVEDFCGLCAALSEIESFDSKRIAAFINCTILIPAPSLGLFDPDVFVQQMQVLRNAWEVFAATFYHERTGYQRRVGGFLLERLHSFLITEQLSKSDTVAVAGHQIIVAAGSYVSPTT